MKGGKKKSSSQPSHGTDIVQPPLPPPPPPPPPEAPAEATAPSTVAAGKTGEEPDHPPYRRQQQQQQQQKQSVAAAAEKEKDGERNRDDGDHEEEEVEAEDAEENHDEHLCAGEGGEEAEGDGERPKLAEGYYEIEAVRKKRVRKGQVQYLIKWRGWPETANTWEPLENLMSISDVIDAFEESLRTGKHRSTRRRKRKHGNTQSQPKKKQQQQQQRSPAAATYDVPAVRVRIIEESLPLPSINDLNCTDHEASSAGKMNVVETDPKEKENENDLRSSLSHIGDRKEQDEMDLTLNELREAMATNGNNMDKGSGDCHETQMTRVDGLANGMLKVDVETVQTGRCSGAKRRKSGSVKRFRQDSTSSVNGDAQALTITNFSDTYAADGQLGNDVACTSNLSESICIITEIIKPISYSSSMLNNVNDVSITFVAKRSDGKEVMVDNKYLKANNPLLLINFYEQHLRYNPT